jgi:hypothetical protein
VTAPTYSEAEERLIDAIQNAGGAMHAVFEFDPPLPKSALEAKFRKPEVVLIGGDECFTNVAPPWRTLERVKELDEGLRWYDEFYDHPLCRKCRYTSGRRSDALLTLAYTPSNYDGLFGSVGPAVRMSHQLVSGEFLGLLSSEEKSPLEFQSTIRKGRKKYYELIGPPGPPFVAVNGLKINGWRCKKCDQRTWSYFIADLPITFFVARSDLPANLPGVFTVGTAPEIHLAATSRRWKELLGQKGTRGFVSMALGVAPDSVVVRKPDLATFRTWL